MTETMMVGRQNTKNYKCFISGMGDVITWVILFVCFLFFVFFFFFFFFVLFFFFVFFFGFFVVVVVFCIVFKTKCHEHSTLAFSGHASRLFGSRKIPIRAYFIYLFIFIFFILFYFYLFIYLFIFNIKANRIHHSCSEGTRKPNPRVQSSSEKRSLTSFPLERWTRGLACNEERVFCLFFAVVLFFHFWCIQAL